MSSLEHDLALVFVTGDWAGRGVWPACLPSPALTYTGWRHSWVAGWGARQHAQQLTPGAARKV